MEAGAPVVRERKVYRVRVDPFVEFYSPRRFISRFRLDQESVEELAAGFGNSEFATLGTRYGGGISHRERVCLALRYFATGGAYSLIADSQHLSRSTVCRAVIAVTKYLCAHHRQYVFWPEEHQYPNMARDFYEKAGFPRIIGAIDGTHIPILKPSVQERGYVNRKGYHSLNAMFVCDANMVFQYVNARMPGGAHDAYVLTTSMLYDELEAGLTGNYTILGDSGYPLTHYLLTPVLRPEGDAENRYNTALCRTRATVENAFGMMKMRFRCLDGSGGYIMSKPQVCVSMVLAIACLHNIAIRRRVPLIPEPVDQQNVFQQPAHEVMNDVQPGGPEARRLEIEYFA